MHGITGYTEEIIYSKEILLYFFLDIIAGMHK